jgi:uncharacterized protein YkwD
MEINCPICTIPIELTKEHIGQKGRCPNCESKFIIPPVPDGEFQILHRGRIPDKVQVRKLTPALPPGGQVVRGRIPARSSLRKSGSPAGMIATATICAAAVAGFILLRDKGGNATEATPPAAAPAEPSTASGQAPASPMPPIRPEPAAPTLVEAAPAPSPEIAGARTPADPSPEPEAVAPPPAEERLPALTDAQKAKSLTFLKSNQASRRQAAYAGFRKRGEHDKAIYLELLVEALAYHSDALSDRAWDLATEDKDLTSFKDAHDSWTAARDAAKEMAQTNWKDQDANNYKRKHGEMDDITEKAMKFYAQVVRYAGRAGSAPSPGLQQFADALAEIRREVAWCEDREPDSPLDLLGEITETGAADDYVATINLIATANQIAAELEAAEQFNAGCGWAGDAYKTFGSTLNPRRVALGLTPLRLDEKLSNACRDHSADMAANGYFSHTGLTPETKDFGTRAKRAGFSGFATGECIFMGNASPTAAHDAWWYSDGHRLIMYANNPNTLGLGLHGKHWTLNTAKK